MIAITCDGMTGRMRNVAVVLILSVVVGFSHRARAEKPAPRTEAKEAESAATAKKRTPSTSAAKPAPTGILGTLSDPTQVTLQLGTPTVKGALDSKAVATVVRRSQSKLLACGKEWIDKDKKAGKKVTVTLTFTIGADGKVRAGKATGLDERARKCIIAEISKLQFEVANADQGTTVRYPLTFRAEPPVFVGLSDLSPGLDDTEIYGGLIGEGPTYGGLGTRGTGPGGGGTGEGTIGIGTLGTIGHGGGGGTGSGYGRGRVLTPAPTVAVGQGSATGHLDKAIIRRYIKRNLAKIRYCYERELVKKKALQGTVTVSFTIGVDGRVSSSTASGMGDTNVESCVARVIAQIEFPQPKGGVVVVRYPFTFQSAEDVRDARTP